MSDWPHATSSRSRPAIPIRRCLHGTRSATSPRSILTGTDADACFSTAPRAATGRSSTRCRTCWTTAASRRRQTRSSSRPARSRRWICARACSSMPATSALVELPAYTGAMTSFWNAQGHLVGVQQDAAGIDIADLDRVAAARARRGPARRVRLCGAEFPEPDRPADDARAARGAARLGAARDVLIVEDDPYGALYFDDVAKVAETRPIKADDREGRVVYLSSFSKTVAPGFRVAWIAAAPPLVARSRDREAVGRSCAPVPSISGSSTRSGAEDVLESRLASFARAYQRKRTVLEQALRRELGGHVTWPEPKGGFFLWASFGDGIDTDALLRRAIAHGVVFVPGSAFYVEPHHLNRARLSFSAPPPDANRGGRRAAGELRCAKSSRSGEGQDRNHRRVGQRRERRRKAGRRNEPDDRRAFRRCRSSRRPAPEHLRSRRREAARQDRRQRQLSCRRAGRARVASHRRRRPPTMSVLPASSGRAARPQWQRALPLLRSAVPIEAAQDVVERDEVEPIVQPRRACR